MDRCGGGDVQGPKSKLPIDGAIKIMIKHLPNERKEYYGVDPIVFIVVNSDNCRGIYTAIQLRDYGFFLKLRKALDKEPGQ